MGKNWAGPFFPHPDKTKHQPCADGYHLTGPLFSRPDKWKHKPYPVMNTPKTMLFREWGKTRSAHSFTTPTRQSIHHVQMVIWVEKNLAGLLFSHPGPAHSFPTLTSESINLVQKLGYLGGEKLGWPILSPPRLVKVWTLPCHEYANNLCFLGDGGKIWPAHSFPTPSSESINLTLSCICKQPLLFRGWGKTGQAHSFPTLTKIKHQPCAGGYLAREKLG